MVQQESNLDFMEQLLSCGTNIFLWHYDLEGHLIRTNANHLVLDTIFAHSGNKQYMLEQASKYTAPLILGGQMGLMWCAVFEQKEGKPHSFYVLGPVFHAELSAMTIEQSVQIYNIDLSWRQQYIELMQSLPVLSSILFFQYALMMHYCITGEKQNRSDLHFRDWNAPADADEKEAPKGDRMRVWLTERTLLNMVREGNLNYQAALAQASLFSDGVRTGGKNPLLQAIVSSNIYNTSATPIV